MPKCGGGENPDSLIVNFVDTTQNLQVNGSMVVDSSLTVKDSVVMEDNLHIYEKLRLEKDAYLRRDVFVGNKLVVDAESYFNGNAYFNQKVFLDDLATLDSQAFADSSASLSVTEKPNVLFVDENGMVLKSGANSITDIVYKSPCKTDINGNVPNPTWLNGMNKIYSPCARVGIFNSNPRVALDVSGKAYVSHLAIGIANPMQQTTVRFHLKTPLSPSKESTLFLIENNERKLMQLNNQGLLQVREVKIDLVAWPDYVFEPNYNLRPLSEVKKFISENKHLPNVPSAKEIEENGLNLGEGNKILLEKVEEMTLYMIQLEENLKKQEELLKTQAEILKVQQEQITILQTKNK